MLGHCFPQCWSSLMPSSVSLVCIQSQVLLCLGNGISVDWLMGTHGQLIKLSHIDQGEIRAVMSMHYPSAEEGPSLCTYSLSTFPGRLVMGEGKQPAPL
jgi:hypothetical protein